MNLKLARLRSLLEYADNQQKEISDEYSRYLDCDIPPSLQIKIKNYFENARSLLDYIASDICVAVLRLSNKHKCYFPINIRTQNEFQKFCKINFPNLETVDSAIYAALANTQPFNTNNLSSLRLLSTYTNKNKHRDLSQQKMVVETHAASRFKVIRFDDIGKEKLIKDLCDGYLIADETKVDEFLGSDYILNNIGNIIELNPASVRYISFKFDDSDQDVIATLINIQTAISDVLERFTEPLYERYTE
ncbi:hypothetical protein KP003_00385 [Geomonas nitrogeniifigens]|uniref:hypothetical protein n=1 Tax=Geomonas diazotrophica TaxID=2843197 RepID=UPI001C2CB18C|nr:hypothetical protein [Geomonas nitrogeniifigens]QXE86901.1 hypothetical protein KP003_00385 [Geomonas nitrogeniifigens]